MWRKAFGTALAVAGLSLGLALPVVPQAGAAPQATASTNIQKVKKRNVERRARAARVVKKRQRREARRATPRRKTNFSVARRADTRRADARLRPARAPLASSTRMAALFGGIGSSGAFTRRDGRIYDASGRYLGKTVVDFKRKLKPGTILVKTRERALYYVLPGGKALKYGVGVGREGFQWSGRHRITMKKEWPEWRPPAEMKRREWIKYGRKLPDVMPGGPDNPLGARALYIGNTLYRIHGTIAPDSIGKFVSSGCIRMLNEEVIDLYEKVKVGARVIVE